MKICKKLFSALLAVCILFSTATSALAVVGPDPSDSASAWAKDDVRAAIDHQLVPLELQRNYQTDITRGEFAKTALYFLCVLYDYPEFWADGISGKTVVKDFVCDYLEQAREDGTPRYLMEDFLGQVPEALREEMEQRGWQELLSVMTPFEESGEDFFFIHAAYVLGIVNGRDDGTFGPDDPITRQEAAAMLTRTNQLYNPEAAELEMDKIHTEYTDQDQIGPWAQSAVDIMTYYKIMNGTGEGAFSPLSHYTREQCIVTFERLLQSAPANLTEESDPSFSPLDARLKAVYDEPGNVLKRWDTDDAVIITDRYHMITPHGGYPVSAHIHVLYRSGNREDIFISLYPYDWSPGISLSEDQQYVYYSQQGETDERKSYRINIKTGEIEEIS